MTGARPLPRVWSHGRVRFGGAEYVSESVMQWMSGSGKRQCDRPVPAPPPPAQLRQPPLAVSGDIIFTHLCLLSVEKRYGNMHYGGTQMTSLLGAYRRLDC